MGKVVVYYVTAVRHGAGEDPAAANAAAIAAAVTGVTTPPGSKQRVRSDVAKFFRDEHAAAHAAAGLGPGWYDACVEHRVEDEEEQHEAHRAAEGRRAAWHREEKLVPEWAQRVLSTKPITPDMLTVVHVPADREHVLPEKIVAAPAMAPEKADAILDAAERILVEHADIEVEE